MAVPDAWRSVAATPVTDAERRAHLLRQPNSRRQHQASGWEHEQAEQTVISKPVAEMLDAEIQAQRMR